MEEFLLVQDLVQVNTFLYDIDNFDGSLVGELARKRAQKLCNTVRLLRCYLLRLQNQCLINI